MQNLEEKPARELGSSAGLGQPGKERQAGAKGRQTVNHV